MRYKKIQHIKFSKAKKESNSIELKERENISNDIAYLFSNLPTKKPSKKASYEISLETYETFDRFSNILNNEHRISKNDLIEIALIKLMNDLKEK